NFWDGAQWHWWNGDPPFDLIGDVPMYPNGSESGNKHWVIRRWRSEVNGQITVNWNMTKQGGDGAGVTGRLFVNGVQKDSATLPGSTVTVLNRTVVISNVQV